ncbi:hypothetical protein B0H10DRAFT_2244135, partial [Mycena sp. CBHHK59/15]
TATTASESESTTTAPSLFGDDNVAPAVADGDGTDASDFFSTVPHTNYQLDSSVAATVGRRAFNIYPATSSPTDRLITQALVLGDFESAVSLCLASSRFADAILLAVRGGATLLRRTQDAYFAHTLSQQGGNGGSGRVLQAVVNADLGDVVKNADVKEWREVFVVLCTFAGREKGEFEGLVEELAGRLESQGRHVKEEGDDADGKEWRKNATLAYLAAGKLERLVGIWGEEMAEDEEKGLSTGAGSSASVYSARAHALQTFIEKVTVFRAATGYVDSDLAASSEETEKTYKLAGLYDRYYEYAALLAAQGLVDEAVKFLQLTPGAYGDSEVKGERERLIKASSKAPAAAPVPAALPATVIRSGAAAAPRALHNYQAPTQPTQASTGGQYSQASTPYNAPLPNSSAYAPLPSQTMNSGYAPPAMATNTYTTPVQNSGYAPPPTNPAYAPAQPNNSPYPQAQTNNAPYRNGTASYPTQASLMREPPHMAPPPPRSNSLVHNMGPPAPPPKRQEKGGWNDAPIMPNSRLTPGPINPPKPSAITAPFPNSMPASPGFNTPVSPYMNPGQQQSFPPPPRPGSVQGPPPPRGILPKAGPRLTGGGPPRLPTPSQYGPPPSRAPAPGQTAPAAPGQFARQAPPPGQQPPAGYARPTPPPGQASYGRTTPPPQQQQQHPGPYGPPSGSQQRPGPPQGLGGQPPPAGPPPAAASAAAARAPLKGPPPPKYPPGDRSHIPEAAQPVFVVISQQLAQMRQTTPPQQKRLVDDLERRINPLFDALNCETLSPPVAEQLLVLTRAMESHDRQAALAIHVDLLTRGSQTDDIGLWMSGIKQLIMRL